MKVLDFHIISAAQPLTAPHQKRVVDCEDQIVSNKPVPSVGVLAQWERVDLLSLRFRVRVPGTSTL